MRDYITLGSSPVNEDCAQVGSEDYYLKSRAELVELTRMMETIHPQPGNGAFYAVKAFQHDFGTYRELCAIFDDDDPEQAEWAYQAEELVPEDWDEEAKRNIQDWRGQG